MGLSTSGVKSSQDAPSRRSDSAGYLAIPEGLARLLARCSARRDEHGPYNSAAGFALIESTIKDWTSRNRRS